MSIIGDDYNKAVRKPNAMWLTSLADLLALLLAFFVLVFAMNEIKHDTWEKMLDTLGNPLNQMTEMLDPGVTADKNVELFSEQKAFDLNYLDKVISAKIASSEQLSAVKVFKSADRLIISFTGDTFFQAGDNEVSAQLQNATRLLGDSLRYVKNRIEVYGHSDPTPVSNLSANKLSNWGLSLSRALSVSDTLKKSGYGYPIRVFGMADSRFFEQQKLGTLEEQYAMARRVDIVIREAERLGR